MDDEPSNPIAVSPSLYKHLLAAQMLLAGAGVSVMDTAPRRFRQPDRKSKECLLPGCNKMTTHNGGYCSADHKRLSKVAR